LYAVISGGGEGGRGNVEREAEDLGSGPRSVIKEGKLVAEGRKGKPNIFEAAGKEEAARPFRPFALAKTRAGTLVDSQSKEEVNEHSSSEEKKIKGTKTNLCKSPADSLPPPEKGEAGRTA